MAFRKLQARVQGVGVGEAAHALFQGLLLGNDDVGHAGVGQLLVQHALHERAAVVVLYVPVPLHACHPLLPIGQFTTVASARLSDVLCLDRGRVVPGNLEIEPTRSFNISTDTMGMWIGRLHIIQGSTSAHEVCNDA